jgi:hypothetical protein
VLAVSGAALAVGACGSSGGLASTGPSKSYAQAVKFSACMRAHGLPDFPDPSASGGGIQFKVGGPVNPFSPAFKTAQAACRKLAPGFGGGGPPSAQAKARLLAISQCMRAHGISDFPDPTTTPPSSGPGNFSLVLGTGGVFLEVPRTIDVLSPAFKQAATKCHFGGPH